MKLYREVAPGGLIPPGLSRCRPWRAWAFSLYFVWIVYFKAQSPLIDDDRVYFGATWQPWKREQNVPH